MDLNLYQTNINGTIAVALQKINNNKEGAVFITDHNESVVGILTDGDIRSFLIKSNDTKAPIEKAINKNFVYVNENCSRESVLKLLDHKIKIIPVIDKDRKLVKVYSRTSFPLHNSAKSVVHSKSPVRISFSGGGSDLTQYFFENGGVALNSTISMFSHSTLKKRSDQSIKIISHDLNEVVEVDNLEALFKTKNIPLVNSLLKLLRPEFGFELQISSDFPVGSGLGGSAVVLSSIIGCFNQMNEDRWDSYEIAEIAFQAERLFMDVAGGWQDQYATVFGGFNFMEFNKESNIIHPLRIRSDIKLELEESLLLCYTGKAHDSGSIQKNHNKNLSNGSIANIVEENKALSYKMKGMLLRGKLSEFGDCLHKGWELKKQFSTGISDTGLDKIYTVARENGAKGGKLLGAGGGGYFLFYVNPFQRAQLKHALENKLGLKTQNFVFDEKGLQTCRLKS
jgi:D-glycero-alpha-D-manno-heptose-7-phosphate kinase